MINLNALFFHLTVSNIHMSFSHTTMTFADQSRLLNIFVYMCFLTPFFYLSGHVYLRDLIKKMCSPAGFKCVFLLCRRNDHLIQQIKVWSFSLLSLLNAQASKHNSKCLKKNKSIYLRVGINKKCSTQK